MFEKKLEISMLYEFYGQLLTPKQKEIMKMYYDDDYTLTEIAEDMDISRQAVFDAAKNAEKSLRSYEDKLGLLRKFAKTEVALDRAGVEIEAIIKDYTDIAGLSERLNVVKVIIGMLDEE